MNRQTRVFLLTVVCLCAAACASDPAAPDTDGLGVVTAALQATPPSVRCIIIDVTEGSWATGQSFSVGGGASSFRLTGLPLGWSKFSATAFPGNCNNLSGVAASYVSDPVWADVSATPSTIMLQMRPSGSTGGSSVAITFPTPRGQLTEYSMPSSKTGASAIVAGGDGSLWYAHPTANSIGKIYPWGGIVEFPLPTLGSAPWGIALGPDGNIWFTESGAIGQIGRVSEDGTLREFYMPTTSPGLRALTAGADGNLWFIEQNLNKIGRLSPTGSFADFSIITANSYPFGITAGPDGNIWFTQYNGNRIARVLSNGAMTEFIIPGTNPRPMHITTGPDGNLWFAQYGASKIGSFNVSTFTFSEFAVPYSPVYIVSGNDGKLWFTTSGGYLYTISTAGVVSQVPVLLNKAGVPCPLAVGSDGHAWLLENEMAKVARVTM